MPKPRLLDLFCKAGGAGMGYSRAGFDVVGVDHEPQPNYPFPFIQADALTVSLEGYDAIHASPPCQIFSAMTRGRWQDRAHPDLLVPIRGRLLAAGVPFVIENVVGSPLINPVLLCGSMFGLQTSHGNQLRRHRLFELHPPFVLLAPPCQHNHASPIGVYGGGQHPHRRRGVSVASDGLPFGVRERREAMGIDWMSSRELSQAIPPVYTEFLGRQLLAAVAARRAA